MFLCGFSLYYSEFLAGKTLFSESYQTKFSSLFCTERR